MKKILVVLAVVVGIGSVAYLVKGHKSGSTVETIDTSSGKKSEVSFEDLKVGDGALAEKAKMVTLHYSTYIKAGMKKIDSSVDRGQEFKFKLGAGQVVRGWELGMEGMKVGGKRKINVPSELGYGEKGAGRVVPPNSDLVYEVELLGVSEYVPASAAATAPAPAAKAEKKASKPKKK